MRALVDTCVIAIAETALHSGCDCIVTRNLKDYKNASIPSYSPTDFFRLITPAED